ncbi:histidine phosphatase family protein [Glycomyces tenuis]|uniref:histidine phosphatase family protein n=1 Tax=Glycomyces tenuis TaxID=58116 RepID=UPI00068FC850|nr:histidine phosphatase family protein [Glycomyces tenuis]
MAVFYVVQHGEKERSAGDPGLTERGRRQAALAAERLRGAGLTGVFAGPLRRARETAEAVAAASGLEVRTDARLTERMNWDGSLPIAAFLEEWSRASRDRDFVPSVGDSSRAAGARFREFLVEHGGGDAVLAVACHGGVTVDLLRTLLGDDGVPESLLREGVPSGAVTTLRGLEVVEIASVSHLEGMESAHRP